MIRRDEHLDCLVLEIEQFLGPRLPDKNKKIARWRIKGFEVAVQRDGRLHIWLSASHQPANLSTSNLEVERYEAGRGRHSGLRPMRTLSEGNPAHRIKFVEDMIPSAVQRVREYAASAGVIQKETM